MNGRGHESASPEMRSVPLVGTVSLSGAATAVQTDAEWRNVTLCGPGGYVWRPPVGASLLVLKDGQNESFAVAAVQPSAGELKPGEVRIEAGDASMALSQDGVIRLCGTVLINGRAVALGAVEEE